MMFISLSLRRKRKGDCMAKAVLIMDMPESCDMCDFVDDEQPPRYGEKTLYCGIPGMGEDVTDYIACRPEFCPLRELPEKKEEFELRECKGSVKGTWKVPLIENKGFNACLDEILN